MQGCAGLGLAVDVNASLEEESGEKSGGAGRAYSRSPLPQYPKAEPQFPSTLGLTSPTHIPDNMVPDSDQALVEMPAFY